MKLHAALNLPKNEITLHYDLELRDLFHEVTEPIKQYLLNQAPKRCDTKQLEDFGRGFKTIQQIGTTLALTITPQDADFALDLVSFSSFYLARNRETAELFARVVLTLAEITPGELLISPLPPAAELLNSSIPQEVIRNYERLQTWKTPRLPHLTIRQQCELLQHLMPLRNHAAAVAALVLHLHAHTLFFRSTMENLARMDLLNGAAGEESS